MTTKEAADMICKELMKSGCMIHRNDAYSTSSIYLKVDAGAGSTIRIADHPGIKYLPYRFNLSVNEEGNAVRREFQPQKPVRIFYQSGAVEKLIKDVLETRRIRIHNYRDYFALRQRLLTEEESDSSFWKNAVLVDPNIYKEAI